MLQGSLRIVLKLLVDVHLQERMATLEVLVQRQQQLMQEQWQTLQQQQQQQQPPPPSSSLMPSSPLSSRRSPTRCSSSPSASAGMAAAAAIAANSPVGGVLSRDAILQQHSILSEGPPSGNRLYKSAEWGGLQGCSSGRKGLVTPIDPLAVGRRSFNCLTPGSSASGGLRVSGWWWSHGCRGGGYACCHSGLNQHTQAASPSSTRRRMGNIQVATHWCQQVQSR
jgi:hypothetical protein